MENIINKVLDFIAQLAKLDFIGGLVLRGVLSSNAARVIESAIHGAEMTLIVYIMSSLGTGDWSKVGASFYAFLITVLCGILSGFLIDLRKKKEILEIIQPDGANSNQ